jgi:hypothetical protein
MTRRRKLIDALQSLAKSAERSDHWIDTGRLMPAEGVADTVYEALDWLEGERRENIRLRSELQTARGYRRGAERDAEKAVMDLLEKHHRCYMAALGRNPDDYTSEFSLAADALRAALRKGGMAG